MGRAWVDPVACLLAAVYQAMGGAIRPPSRKARFAGGSIRLVAIGKSRLDDARGIEAHEFAAPFPGDE